MKVIIRRDIIFHENDLFLGGFELPSSLNIPLKSVFSLSNEEIVEVQAPIPAVDHAPAVEQAPIPAVAPAEEQPCGAPADIQQFDVQDSQSEGSAVLSRWAK